MDDKVGDGATNLVQFSPFNSFVEPGFWWKLTEHKVNVYKLDDTPKHIRAYYSNANSPGLPCRLTIDFSALDPSNTPPANCSVSHGVMYLANTIEAFRTYPKKELLRNVGISIWSDIRSGSVFNDQSLLSRFILLCYVDAKKYIYYYWFGYPALCFPDDIQFCDSGVQTLSEAYSPEEIEALQRICSAFTREDATGYFVLEECDKSLLQPQPLSKVKDTKCDASKQRVVVRFSMRKNRDAKEMDATLVEGYGDTALPYATVIDWMHKFSEGHDGLEDDHSSGRPCTVTDDESVSLVEDGWLLDDFSPVDTTINGPYYANVMAQLREAIKSKRHCKLSSGVLLLHDNARPRRATISQAAIRKAGFKELKHPLYSTVLVPSYFHTLRQLKSHFRGKCYSSNDDVKAAVMAWLDDMPFSFWEAGVNACREDWMTCFNSGGDYVEKQTCSLILAFCDPSTHESAPGWPARNLLALWAHYRPDAKKVRLLCWRQRYHKGKVACEHSLLVHVTFTTGGDHGAVEESANESLKVVGWEKNEKGQLGHRMVDLSASMQPSKLADSAVSLNLQLMRWRLVPDLNLDLLQNTSCLIFGAGTLGCNVARCCLGWGIRKITFVDCGKVSYSNPVRQSLFTFDDCLDGGQWKAEAAAAGLRKIFPSAETTGVRCTVPMPGHVVSIEEMPEVMKTVAAIEELVKSHDLLFLLLDTREGRWLPTLLASMHSKLTFSVALGFDSYVVVRHGLGCDPDGTKSAAIPLSAKFIPGDRLGCYFCTDVVAPSDSTADRTLDQQCTVTRPGLSMIASALAVELAVSVLQHPIKGLAPAEIIHHREDTSTRGHGNEVGDEADATSDPSSNSCLGYVAHQIRGYASTYEQMTATVQRFSSCTACSHSVLSQYRKRGFEFLRAVFNNPAELERVTGLDELKRHTDTAQVVFLSDCDSD